jgi:F-box/leucine-rich repeat protein 2/20
LGFVNCRRITDKGFSEAVRKLALLEGLDISLCNLSKDCLEVVGRSCTLLKWFKFVRQGFYDDYDGDDEAFVIAETMSGLCALNISGNDITDVGLIAILDGCPLLETLIIRRCYDLDLSGSLRKRCLEQIKNLQLPIHHDIEEYYYDDHVSYHDSVLDDECYDPYD